MIYDYFRTEDHMSQVYGFNDLTDLTWYGDDRMLEFMAQWGYIIDHLEEDVTDKTLRYLLFRQAGKSK
eukprot:7114105-Lingulodinium_polyedra.AAC.1